MLGFLERTVIRKLYTREGRFLCCVSDVAALLLIAAAVVGKAGSFFNGTAQLKLMLAALVLAMLPLISIIPLYFDLDFARDRAETAEADRELRGRLLFVAFEVMLLVL